MPLPIPLRRDGGLTLQEQIYRFIRDAVIAGTYREGLQLPSSRDLAQSLRVSRNTVVLAYDWLETEGYIEMRRGAGAFVRQVLADEVDLGQGVGGVGAAPARLELAYPFRLPVLSRLRPRRPQFDFAYGRLDPRQFPLKLWRQLTLECLAHAERPLTEYVDQAGELAARQAVANHLATARGMVVTADQIVMTSGAQEALNIVSRLFVRPGVQVAVEDPCYASAASLFRSYGAELAPIPVDENGLVTDMLHVVSPALLYTTPSHQFPTGVVTSLERRQAVLAWAADRNVFVIEDDYDSEIIYDRPPMAALAALDRNRRVIYVGSFSKTIGGGLRIGFLALPPELCEPAIAVKSLSSYGVPWLEQAVIAGFLREDRFRTYLRRMRNLYRARRDALISVLAECFGDSLRISGQDSGLHLVATLGAELPDADTVASIAATVGVGLYTPRGAGAIDFAPLPGPERRLILGYGALTPEEIDSGIRRVARTLATRAQGPLERDTLQRTALPT